MSFFTKDEAETVKKLCDLLCLKYGMNANSNLYGLNVAHCAMALAFKVEADMAPQKPELVKTATDEPIAAA